MVRMRKEEKKVVRRIVVKEAVMMTISIFSKKSIRIQHLVQDDG
jgi:hypothetical protein